MRPAFSSPGPFPPASLKTPAVHSDVYLEMIILDIMIVAWMAAGCLYWLAVLYLTIRVIKSVPLLEMMPAPEREEWPQVSVIVPVRDELENLGGPVASRLEDDYPGLELVLVDDRSSDGTSKRIDEMAASDTRVKAVHVSDLPGGWLGKVYAMQRGIEESGGEWMVFSDADTYVKPGALARAVSYCESRGLDHLAVIPELYRCKALQDSVSQVLLRIMLITERVWKAADERSSAAVGSPSFALVRRAAIEDAGGLAELRMEPTEDIAIAQMLKTAGGRSGAVNGRGYVGAFFCRSLRETAVSLERGVYATLGGFSLARVFWFTLLFFALEFGPYLFFIPMGIPYNELIGTVAVSLGMIVSILICRWLRMPLAAAFFFPIDLLIVVYMLLRAGIVCAAQGGIIWRDTFYPTEMLRMGRRFSYH